MPHVEIYCCSIRSAIGIFTYPLTEVIQAGAKELLRTAIQAEVAGFMTAHAHLLDEEGRQRLVRHGFLPEREVMTGIGTVPVQVPRVRA